MTITDEELANLPGDPHEKFMALLDIARRYEKAGFVAKSEGDASKDIKTYLNIVLTAAKELDVKPIARFDYPTLGNALSYYDHIQPELEDYLLRRRIRSAVALKTNSVRFEPATKEKLRHHLDQIRKAVDESRLSDAKKERLYECIAALGLEIDKDRTPMEALGRLMADFATASTPLIEKAQEIAKIFGYAKEQEDAARLPAPKKPKQIEHKPDQLQPPPKASNGADSKAPV